MLGFRVYAKAQALGRTFLPVLQGLRRGGTLRQTAVHVLQLDSVLPQLGFLNPKP